MEQIIAGVVFFTTIIVFLILLIQIARSKLVTVGEVNIIVNGNTDAPLKAAVGSKLSSALADNKIFVSAACGGSGTCGQCKVRVLSGAGDILPTEESFITPKEARNSVRLSCQVSLKQDINIDLPPEIFSAKVWDCEVIENNNISAIINEIVFQLPKGEEMDFKAGGYIQITRPGNLDIKYSDFNISDKYRPFWEKEGYFNLTSYTSEPVEKAYSMANYPGEAGKIILNIRIATPPKPDLPPGAVSSWLFSLKPGDKVKLSGPFGHFYAQDTKNEMVLIGSGAGMAPLRSIVLDELVRKKSGRKISFWYGARNLDTMFYTDSFNALAAEYPNFKWDMCLSRPESGWEGYKGYVYSLCYEKHLKNLDAPEDCEYYLCGPTAMMSSTVKMLKDLGVPEENIYFDDFG